MSSLGFWKELTCTHILLMKCMYSSVFFWYQYALSTKDQEGSNYNSSWYLAFNFECHVVFNACVCMTLFLHSTMYSWVQVHLGYLFPDIQNRSSWPTFIRTPSTYILYKVKNHLFEKFNNTSTFIWSFR